MTLDQKLRERLVEALTAYGIQDVPFCMDIIDKFKQKEDQKEEDWLKEHTDHDTGRNIYFDTIESLKEKLTAREYNALYRYYVAQGIRTIRELCDTSYKDIKSLRNIGTVSAVNIYNQIRNTYGIRLSGYEEFVKDFAKVC